MIDFETDKKLKIAIIAPIWLRVPPRAYGGIELVVALLADELADRGHDVTLFATKDAVTRAKLAYVFEEAQSADIGRLAPEIFHVGASYEMIKEGGFDIVHDHTYSAPAMGVSCDAPVLMTLHGEFNEENVQYFEHFKNSIYFNAISESQRAGLPGLRYVNTVYNAIDFSSIPLVSEKQDYLLALSRISLQKGPHVAIEVAKRAGRKLVLAGKVNEGVDVEYFRTMVEPHIDGDRVVFLGEVDDREKARLMGEAACFLFPIQWSEPFGLVMLEAMAAGTPVLAFNRGSAAEVVKDGVGGFLARDTDQMVEMVTKVDQLDPAACREYATTTFSVDRMVDGYLENYFDILRSEGRIGRSLTMA